MTDSGSETTLDLTDRAVKTPVSRSRRRRYWMVWWLWAIFGAAVSFRGMPAGGWLVVAGILTAPFWALFAAWPVLWLADRMRARRLWAEEVAIVTAPSGAAGEDTALPVIFGRERAADGSGVRIPLLAWEAAFPTVRPEVFGLEVLPAGKLPGVALPTLEAAALFARDFDGGEKNGRAAPEDLEAARLWTAQLRRVL